MNILDQIMEKKREELEVARAKTPESELRQRAMAAPPPRSLKKSLLDRGKTGIIAEFKRRSPSRGAINLQADPGQVAKAYASFGASGVSVLTDNSFFGGSQDDLSSARASCSIPVLRKDFILDEYQVLESRAIGADALLLIAACLDRDTIARLAGLAHSLGMETLLEVHDEKELEKICPLVDLIGVNNRDLTTFQVDLGRSLDLAKKIDKQRVKIAESGISQPAALVTLRKAGYLGFLIGECFMSTPDPGEAFRAFVQQLES